MAPVKVKIFISFAPADIGAANTLLTWLYPMRDEVDIGPSPILPPKRPQELGLSWKIIFSFWRVILFWKNFGNKDWYEQALEDYASKVNKQRENAHIYLFLTSYNSISNKQVDEDIALAASRRILWEWEPPQAPYVLPILLSPSLWNEVSPLARFTPLADGLPLSKFPQMEDGYLMVTQQISARVKMLQRSLNEYRYYQYFPDVY